MEHIWVFRVLLKVSLDFEVCKVIGGRSKIEYKHTSVKKLFRCKMWTCDISEIDNNSLIYMFFILFPCCKGEAGHFSHRCNFNAESYTFTFSDMFNKELDQRLGQFAAFSNIQNNTCVTSAQIVQNILQRKYLHSIVVYNNNMFRVEENRTSIFC